MAKQRVVNTYFWSDEYILDLRADEKLLFLYVLTNPETDLCGAYQIAMKKMVFETKITEGRIRVILGKFAAAGKVFYEDGWMIVRNFAKHQVKNPKVSQGIERSLKGCPDWVKDRLSKPIDTLRKGGALLPELLLEPEPIGVMDAREPSFAETVMEGIRSELGILQLPDEPSWFIEIERAQKNNFTADHCIETFRLMQKQGWRGGPIKPLVWAQNLPNLHKLRQERNGTTKQPSEREKSAQRNIEQEQLANDIRSGKYDEAVEKLFSRDGDDNSEKRILRELPGAH